MSFGGLHVNLVEPLGPATLRVSFACASINEFQMKFCIARGIRTVAALSSAVSSTVILKYIVFFQTFLFVHFLKKFTDHHNWPTRGITSRMPAGTLLGVRTPTRILKCPDRVPIGH